MFQIFLSYRRSGGDALAYLLYNSLKNRGYTPFYDFESLKTGTFDTKIYSTMDECTDYILLCTLNSLNRSPFPEDWLYSEIKHALNLASEGKINIIPVMVEGFTFPEDLPKDIAAIAKYNGLKISYEFFDGFMDKLEDMLSCSNTKALNKETDGATSNNVLIWADINSNLLKKILKKTDPERKYNFVVLEAPSDILKQKNINSYYAIIFIDVDMDRLGDSEKKVKSVNDLIVKYVDDGGLFIATHDIVFKKMRNEGIIEMTGLWTNYFEAVERVKYIKQPICDEIGMFKSLPNEFDLGDAEECWGANSPDNINYFVSDKGRSLVVGNDYGDGAWFWLNTGDAREYPPETILKNETNFSLLIKDALEYRKIMNQP